MTISSMFELTRPSLIMMIIRHTNGVVPRNNLKEHATGIVYRYLQW